MTMSKKTKRYNTITVVAYIIHLLTFPFTWLYRQVQKVNFLYQKRQAINKAMSLHARNGKRYYVVQFNKNFLVGTREYFRRYNRKGKRIVRKNTVAHQVDFDYRRAIIFHTK